MKNLEAREIPSHNVCYYGVLIGHCQSASKNFDHLLELSMVMMVSQRLILNRPTIKISLHALDLDLCCQEG
jgi:hypothetical protein